MLLFKCNIRWNHRLCPCTISDLDVTLTLQLSSDYDSAVISGDISSAHLDAELRKERDSPDLDMGIYDPSQSMLLYLYIYMSYEY